MFKFKLVSEKPDRQTVFDLLIKRYGESYRHSLQDILVGQSNWIGGVLLNYCPWRLLEKTVKFYFREHDYHVNVADIRVFLYVFKPDKDYNYNVNFSMLVSRQNLVPSDYDIMNHCESSTDMEDGQAKISCSTLLSLTNAKQEIHILVIGSYSEGEGGKVSGKTYEVLQNFLISMGYWGSMTCYDPHEIPRTLVYDTLCGEKCKFHVEYRNRKFDYKKKVTGVNRSRITHIMDDAWVPLITKVACKLEDYDGYILNLKDGFSKFAYSYVQHDGKTKILLKSGLDNHKDLPGAIGGGYMNKAGKSITISGTSNRVGHFHPELIRCALTQFNVTIHDDLLFGRANLDPDNHLFKNYPNCVISCKYFGETTFPSGGKVFDQLFYTGLEKRYVYNLPPLRHTMYGCGCRKCAYYGDIISNFKVYDGGSQSTENMIAALVCDPHLMTNRSMLNNVMTYVLTFAHAKSTVKELIDKCQAKFSCSLSTIFRAISLSIRLNRVDLSVVEGTQSYSTYMKVEKQHRYYRDDGDYLIYLDGRFIPSNLSAKIIYRPTAVISTSQSKAIDHFFAKYRSVISYDVVNNRYGDGLYTFGNTTNCVLLINQDKDGAIDTYDGWYLRFSESEV